MTGRGGTASTRSSTSPATAAMKEVLRGDDSTDAAISPPVPAPVLPGVIVGFGRVGQALHAMSGGRDVVVRRGEAIPPDSSGPIFVCTRNDALDDVVAATPPHRRPDLVFLQNGMLDPWLRSRGLADVATQVLVYFAVAAAGDAPTDGRTDTDPDGLTAACGPWATATASRLHAAGLSCKVMERSAFAKPVMEKLLWISSFMLVGARHGGITVGAVEKDFHEEVELLVKEMAHAASKASGVHFDSDLVERLCAYSRSVAHFPTAVKEFQWRNGYFYSLSQEAEAKGELDPLPLHTAWLKEVKAI